MPKVSVIIPFYNVEKHFRKCLLSLFNQTLGDIEYIFVNDGSTDNSLEILSKELTKFRIKKNQVKIIHHSFNKGVSDARLSGMREASGEYLIHCDADDYVEFDMYEKMYLKAKKGNYDFVACFHFREKNGQSEPVEIKYEATPQECLRKKFRNGQNYDMVWDKLIKHSFTQKYNLYPYEGCNFNDDIGITSRLFYYSSSFGLVNEPLYHYCCHANTLSTKRHTLGQLNMKKLLLKNLAIFFDNKEYKTYFNYLKFNTKMQFRELFIEMNKENEWVMLYNECQKDILKFTENPLKTRLLWSIVLSNPYIYKMLSPILKFL